MWKKVLWNKGLITEALLDYTEIVQLLLEKGADVNAKNKYGGWTAYDFAKNDKIKNILKQYGGEGGMML